MKLQETHKYDDIIHLPHPVSSRYAAMSLQDRAAQFSPFAALTGYDAVIGETGRLTEGCTELTEGAKAELNEKLLAVQALLSAQPLVTATYFQPDDRKTGGAYIRVTGRVKKLDTYEGVLLLTDGREIPIDRLYGLEGDFLP